MSDPIIVSPAEAANELLRRRAARSHLIDFATYTQASYVPDPFHRHLAAKLEAVERGDIDRLMIFCPPRHGKTELSSIKFSAWFMARNPGHNIIQASYNVDQATRSSRFTRNIIQSDEFSRVFPQVAIASDSRAADRWMLESGQEYFAVGVGTGATGKGGHLILIDDPLKDREEADSEGRRQTIWDWYNDVIYTRLERGGRIIVIMCMVGDTPVLMADGEEKPLRDIKIGDEVATFEDGAISTSRVLNWKNQGPDFVFAIKTRSGKTVRANERHPFLVERDNGLLWIRLKDLQVGDRMVSVRSDGESGAASSVPSKDAIDLSVAKGSARPTTTRTSGHPGSDHLRSIPSHADVCVSSGDTGSTPASMIVSLPSKTDDALSAAILPVKTCELIGAASSASTTITRPDGSGGCSATTAIWPSDTARASASCATPPNTSGITLDEIISIEADGYEDVFDIEVESTENFIANGLVSHNTRWHHDDLAGRLLAKMKSDPESDRWHVVDLPALCEREDDEMARAIGEALAPNRRSEAELIRIKNNVADRTWSALYQQRPVSTEGAMFNPIWFETIESLSAGRQRVRAWDLASSAKGDWTVGVLMSKDRNGLFVIEDVVRMRESALKVEEAILRTAARDRRLGPTKIVIPQDPGQAGASQAQALSRRLAGYNVRIVKPSGSKETRATAFSAQAEARNVKLSPGDWNRTLLDELATFPLGTHDDQVDACADAFNTLLGPRRAAVIDI